MGLVALKSSDWSSYVSARSAVLSGTISGIPVTMVAAHDQSKRLVIETVDVDGLVALVVLANSLPNWIVEEYRAVVQGQGEMYAESPTLAAYFYRLGQAQ